LWVLMTVQSSPSCSFVGCFWSCTSEREEVGGIQEPSRSENPSRSFRFVFFFLFFSFLFFSAVSKVDGSVTILAGFLFSYSWMV
jgi:hypothetical protein